MPIMRPSGIQVSSSVNTFLFPPPSLPCLYHILPSLIGDQSFPVFQKSVLLLSHPTMSAEEDLIDYSDDEVEVPKATPATNGAAKKDGAASANSKAKGSYVGIQSTSFRDFLLKQELLRAITDCGFEHPSQG